MRPVLVRNETTTVATPVTRVIGIELIILNPEVSPRRVFGTPIYFAKIH